MPTLRFTGARTGLDGISLPKYGPVYRGGEIEVSHEVAERWLREPSDFELVAGDSVEDFWAMPPEPEPIAEPEPRPAKMPRKRTGGKV